VTIFLFIDLFMLFTIITGSTGCTQIYNIDMYSLEKYTHRVHSDIIVICP